MALDRPLAAPPSRGSVFTAAWPVRTGDVDVTGRLRLDGVARYLQDLGNDNLEAIGVARSHPLWIVRRTVIDVLRPAVWPERIRLRRWCSALSTRWTNMRVQIEGDSGSLIETEGFWIHISSETGMPARLDDGFFERLTESADEHRLTWKRWLTESVPTAEQDGVEDSEFVLRHTDIDPFNHVNNAIYWQAVETALADQLLPGGGRLIDTPYRAVIEHLSPVVSADRVVLRARRSETGLTLWYLVENHLRAVARVTTLPYEPGV